MLLFNEAGPDHVYPSDYISKHHMLLFNSFDGNVGRRYKLISKHHMLLFNKTTIIANKTVIIFQNIICYCLTNT